jgi:hypothetical protein
MHLRNWCFPTANSTDSSDGCTLHRDAVIVLVAYELHYSECVGTGFPKASTLAVCAHSEDTITLPSQGKAPKMGRLVSATVPAD